jgi:multimeric flavodoxin WrbA
MKMVVLNGSPKGESSVTMQYVAFIQKRFPQHEFKIFHIAQKIKKIENDQDTLDAIIAEITAADGILWAFPLYVCLVHSQYKRFVELITERSIEYAFNGKHTAILTTSIHFFDHTAHNYLHGICDDLNMKFFASYSAEMQDLFKEKEREKLVDFSQNFFAAIDRDAPAAKVYSPVINENPEYYPGREQFQIPTQGQKVIVLTDAEEHNVNLNRMIGKFTASLNGLVEVVNLRNIDIKGSCLGCIHCGYNNTCVYSNKDGFIDFYNSKLKSADILIFAGTIRDRYLSSLWKTFFDRAFFNTHTPSLQGKQIGFIISGPLRQLPNLRQIFEAYTQWQQANLVSIVTDEHTDSGNIDILLQEMATRSVEYRRQQYSTPATFLGVGGSKIFRDEIWGNLRFPFEADHQFYKANGMYDFPQRDYVTRIRNLFFRLMIKIPAIRREIYSEKMITNMVKPYKKNASASLKR